MREAQLVQVMATLMLTWMSFVTPKPDGSLLASALPKETFFIYDTRFNVRGDNVAFRRPRPPIRVPVPRPITSAQLITTTTRQPTRDRMTPAVRTPMAPAVRRSPQRHTVVHQTDPHRVSPQQQQFVPQQNSGSRRPSGRHHLCGVMPVTGGCRAAFPRYFYNNRTDQCDCFLYGGCGDTGLESSYRNLEECLSKCLPSNRQEGPVCKEIFRGEEVFFDFAVTNPPRRPNPPTPNTNHLSDEHLLSLLINSVSPEDFISYDSDFDYDDNIRNERSHKG